MLLDRLRLIELNSLLCQLLSLKDSDFSKFLNSDFTTVIKPFINCLHAFWSSSVKEDLDTDEDLYELIFKFFLRLCPSFNSKLTIKHKLSSNNPPNHNQILKAVICPKRFIEYLFDVDPLGLLIFLYTNWNNKNDECLEIIREELIPQSFIKKISIEQIEKYETTQTNDEKEFLEWITKMSTIKEGDSLKNNERDSILKRFEYESDDDFFEGEDSDGSSNDHKDSNTNDIDPIQLKLFTFYTSNPSTFSRTKFSRSSPERQVLLQETKLSHEQIEGWALMLERNPKKGRLIQNFLIKSKIS